MASAYFPTAQESALALAACRALGLEVSGKDVLPMEGEFSQNLIAARLGGQVHTGAGLDEVIPNRPLL